MITGHGNNPEEFKENLQADFSTSVYFGGMPTGLKTYLESRVDRVVNYPEPASTTLRERIAAFHGVERSHVIVCNGSTEAFYMLAACFARQTSSILVPSFSEYEDACRLHEHELEFIGKGLSLQDIPSGSRLIWLANPNNPDGRMYSRQEIKELCEADPARRIIVDEAFSGMCPGSESAIGLSADLPNLIVVRSLTKSFAIPGIRLGYLVLHQDAAKLLSPYQVPWSVNTLAQEAGMYIMERYNDLFPDVEQLTERSKKLQQVLMSDIPGLLVTPSACHYFLVRLCRGRASELKTFLLDRYGVLIRDASNFRGLDASYFRLAVQKEAQNQALTEGIREWISGQ